MTVRAIRGAIQVDATDRDAILEGTAELVTAVMSRNDLTPDDVISVLFTVTPDLTAEFPALAARKTGFHAVPLMCATEIPVPGRHAPRGPADGARGHRPAAVGDPARVPARRGGPAAGHRAVSSRRKSRTPGQIPAASPSERRWESRLRPLPAAGEAAMTVLVSGTGLIGTSVALALRAKGAEVWLSDRDQATARLAADLGAGTVVPGSAGRQGDRGRRGARDAAGRWSRRRSPSRRSAASRTCTPMSPASRGCRSGRPASSAATSTATFPGIRWPGGNGTGPPPRGPTCSSGRTWALCPLPETSPAAVEAVTALVLACGADPVITDPETHDQWVALVSHAPHLVAAAMAARLAPSAVPADALRLAGPGTA